MSDNTKKALQIAFGLTVLIAAIFAVLWLAGVIFVLSFKVNPLGKTDVWTWWEYWQAYQARPDIIKKLKFAIVAAGAITFGLPLMAILASSKQRALHGEARFASRSEIRKSGLLDDKPGIIVGKLANKFLTFSGQQFVLLAAPTRSGKGVGVVIPNLLSFPDSVVVLDIKQENFNITAGFRQKYGQKVYLFNPFAEDYRTHRYNPLEYVRDGNFRVGDLQAIGRVFYPGEDPREKFFDDQALNLFTGLGLYLCETPTLPRTIGEMLRQSSGKGKPIKDYLQGIINKRNCREQKTVDAEGNESVVLIPIADWDGKGDPPLSLECVDCFSRFLGTSDNTLSSILASFNAPLGMWVNPIVDAATSANDFDIRHVRTERMTVYVGITPDHLHEAGRLLNLFFSQLINLNTKELPKDNANLKHQCLLLMDEFTAIGKIGIIAKAVSYMAGYNIRLLPIIQSIAQLESVYGREDARTMITNHALQILYAPREQKDANEYSEMLGFETVKSKSISRQRGKSNVNESTSDQRRALLMPQEIKEIGQWKEIIILENVKPIMCDKIQYFEEDVFKKRIMPAPSVPMLDMDTHLAKIAKRERDIREADLATTEGGGINLDKLVTDSKKIMQLREGLENDISVADMVDTFFSAFEEQTSMNEPKEEIDLDGSSYRPSEQELAELDAQPDAYADEAEYSDDMPLSDEERAAMLSESFVDEIPASAAAPGSDDDELLDLSVLEKTS